ncbi:Crp/Fnr family transcriptional regulator [Listeria costaricensis]|uniref:Crp/Fnr family transcriptional regulator n=1 Tax=Listeria costaricensis TaxID=2026604 RepID=UPI000C07E26D|nr:Crp/Fnr family transcriptional regulator [Listeria costaricensis]
MEEIFSYQEFTAMMKKYNFQVITEVVPSKKKILSDEDDLYVSLLMSGVTAGCLKENPKEILTIIGKGYFIGYHKVLDHEPVLVEYKALSDCLIYKYRKEDVQYALSFSENYGFQYFIMKSVCLAVYNKAMLMHQPLHHYLAAVFKTIVDIVVGEEIEDICVLPKGITTSVIMSYSTLSRSSFYTQLLELRQAGIIEKNNNCWSVDMRSIHQLLEEAKTEGEKAVVHS